jgi:hypothetical protein
MKISPTDKKQNKTNNSMKLDIKWKNNIRKYETKEKRQNKLH